MDGEHYDDPVFLITPGAELHHSGGGEHEEKEEEDSVDDGGMASQHVMPQEGQPLVSFLSRLAGRGECVCVLIDRSGESPDLLTDLTD
jgi:hypothetical protein